MCRWRRSRRRRSRPLQTRRHQRLGRAVARVGHPGRRFGNGQARSGQPPPARRERLQTSLLDAVPLVEFLFVDPLPIGADLFANVGLTPEQAATLLDQTRTRWAAAPFTAADLERELRAAIDELGFNRKHSMMTVRLAATGRTATPPLVESLVVLGVTRTLERLTGPGTH